MATLAAPTNFSVCSPIRIGGAELVSAPVPHLAIEDCLDANLASALLDWFEGDAPWMLARRDFYEQYEFALADVSHPAAFRLTDPTALDDLSAKMAALFTARFTAAPRIVAHRLVPGQRIDIHNDSLPGGETHRLLVQVNRGMTDEDGGLLMLFDSARASDVAKLLRPVHRSALAFAISDQSYHAVSKMHSGERFTLVYSFTADDD